MFNVTRTFRVPVGHRLSKHLGLCKNIHGHNLKIQVSVSHFKLNDNDMVIDFSDLKEIVNRYLEEWDHSLILNIKDNMVDQLSKSFKIFLIKGEPTAENLCLFLYQKISAELELIEKSMFVNFIRVWENDDSYAEYRRE